MLHPGERLTKSGADEAWPRVSKNLERLGDYSLLVVAHWKKRARESGLRVYDLSLGDPQEPTPSVIRERLLSSVSESLSYPPAQGLDSLRVSAANWLKRRFSVTYPEQNIVVTAGSKEAIFHTPLAFASRKTPCLQIAYPVPGYPVYENSILLAGCQPRPYFLHADNGFIPRIEDFGDPHTLDMLWVCSPHNPLGLTLAPEVMGEILRWCQKHDVLLLSDECYVDSYDPGAAPPTSFLQLSQETGFRGVLSFFSLSKRSGMTGYRSGFIAGDPTAVKALAQLRPHAGLASPTFVQHAAVAAWDDDEHVGMRSRIFYEKRKVVLEILEGMGWEVVRADATFYTWVRVPEDICGGNARVFLEGLARETGVVATPGDCFGKSAELTSWFRLALVPSCDEIRASMELLCRFADRMRGKKVEEGEF